MKRRIAWIDMAKGVGIILVVIGHAGRGLSGAGVTDENLFLPLMDRTIYAFHMPFFFILAGITFSLSPPANIHPALTQRIWRIFYALVIWTYSFLALRALAGDSSNAGGSLQDVFIWPVPPFAHLWFLWALLVNVLVLSILHFSFSRSVPNLWIWVVAFAISVGSNFTISLPEELAPFFAEALFYSPAFTLGAIIGTSSLGDKVPSPSFASAFAILFLLVLWAEVSFGLPLPRIVVGSALALLLIPSLVFISEHHRRTKWVQFAVFLGVISLAIYVMHTMFSAATRIALFKLGIDDIATHLILGIVAGILGPIPVFLVAQKFRILRAIGLA